MASSNNGVGNGPPVQRTPDKMRKLLQQQLVLLLHGHKCLQKVDIDAQHTPCEVPHCATIKSVLQHMTQCTAGMECTFADAHCASSRKIVQHWKNCQREDCPVCLPLRNISKSQTAAVTEPEPDVNLKDVSCSICHDQLGAKVSALFCGHTFHLHCIQTWLNQSETCPTCRADTPKETLIKQLFFTT